MTRFVNCRTCSTAPRSRSSAASNWACSFVTAPRNVTIGGTTQSRTRQAEARARPHPGGATTVRSHALTPCRHQPMERLGGDKRLSPRTSTFASKVGGVSIPRAKRRNPSITSWNSSPYSSRSSPSMEHHPLQLGKGLLESPIGRGARDPQDLRNLCGRKFLAPFPPKAQHQDRSCGWFELAKRPLQPSEPFLGEHLCFQLWRRSGVHARSNFRRVCVKQPRSAPTPLHFPQSQVMRDRQQPGLRGRFLPEFGNALTGLFKHLLRHILCQSSITVQHTATVVKDRLQVGTGEQFKRTSVIAYHNGGLYLLIYTLVVHLGHGDNAFSREGSLSTCHVSRRMEPIIQEIVFVEQANTSGFCSNTSSGQCTIPTEGYGRPCRLLGCNTTSGNVPGNP